MILAWPPLQAALGFSASGAPWRHPQVRLEAARLIVRELQACKACRIAMRSSVTDHAGRTGPVLRQDAAVGIRRKRERRKLLAQRLVGR